MTGVSEFAESLILFIFIWVTVLSSKIILFAFLFFLFLNLNYLTKTSSINSFFYFKHCHDTLSLNAIFSFTWGTVIPFFFFVRAVLFCFSW